MSRRKQAKPKSTRRDDQPFTYEGDASDGQNLMFTDQVINRQSIGDGDGIDTSEPMDQSAEERHRQSENGEEPDEEDDRESNTSERSTSGTPPTPSNGLTRHECTYCEASFGSFFLLKQHEQDNHAHLMPYKCRFCAKGFKHKRSHDRHEKSHSGIRKHKCSYCGQAFFRSDHLKLHLKTHETSKYAFVCILCQRGFHSSSGLESHMQVHEKQKRSSSVSSADNAATADSRSAADSNQGNETERATPLDFSKVSSPADPPPKPTAASFNPVGGQLQCSVCSATFKTPDHLLRHMDLDHRILKPRMESPSAQRFSQKMTPPPPPLFVFPTPQQPALSSSLVCPYCHTGDFFSEEALELHMQALHGANSNSNGSVTPVDRKWMNQTSAFGCGLCGQTFSDIGLLQKHTLNSHTLKDLDSDGHSCSDGPTPRGRSNLISSGGRISLTTAADPTYECQTCGRSFDSILALHGHASSVHGSLPEHVSTPASTGDGGPSPKSPFVNGDYDLANGSRKISATTPSAHQLYQCGQCDDMVFTDLSAFSAHMRQHVQSSRQASIPKPPSLVSFQEQYPCDLCGAQFSSDGTRDAHLTKHYLQKESQYSCKSCTKTFVVPDELQKHLLDMHAIHLYRCSLCKEIFESRVDIQVHFAVGHSDEVLRYRCRSCNATFLTEDQFNGHVQSVHLNRRSKSGERANSSVGDKNDVGPFDFASSALQSTAAGANGQGSFCCPFCGEAFSVEYLYEKHLENTHRSQMEMFMMNEFIPKASVSQLLMQAAKFKSPFFQNAELSNADGAHPNSVSSRSSWPNSSNGNSMFTFHSPTHNGVSANPTTIIKCNICDRRCETMLELAEHKLQHCKVIHSQNCNFCHEPISSMAEFHAHTRQHNAGNGIPMSCIVCKQSLVSAVDMQTHAKFHLLLTSPTHSSSASSLSSKPSFCSRCGKQTPSTSDSTSQLCIDCTKKEEDMVEQQHSTSSVTSGSSSGVSKCRHCSLKFETAEERSQHECQAHRPQTNSATTASLSPRVAKPYQCIKCQKSFATELEIQAHVTTHVLQDGIHHYCMLCKKVFDSPSKLQCHLIEHSFVGCSEMQCYLCNAIFALPQPLQQHMLTKHGVDDRPYECPFPQCEQKFFFRAELENHAFVHQPPPMSKGASSSLPDETPIGSVDVTSPSLPITCPTCGISFSNGASFSTHSAICTGSSGSSKSRSSVNSQSHTSAANGANSSGSEKKAFTASSASTRTEQLERQQQSRVQTRAGGRKEEGTTNEANIHYCPHCTKTFQSLSALQGHSHVHMVSKTHQCTKCRKIFPTAAKLRNHQRQHSGDKPFPCTMCMRFFSRKDNLKVHMRIHYKQTGSTPGLAPSPGDTTPTGPNVDFPTMVPRSSNFFSSLSQVSMAEMSDKSHVSSQRRDSNTVGSNGDQSSDGSAEPFEYSGAIFGQEQDSAGGGGSSVDDEQSCHANED